MAAEILFSSIFLIAICHLPKVIQLLMCAKYLVQSALADVEFVSGKTVLV